MKHELVLHPVRLPAIFLLFEINIINVSLIYIGQDVSVYFTVLNVFLKIRKL